MSSLNNLSSGNYIDDDRFDGLYLNIANTTRGIKTMLDMVFSFLHRKTDFFNGPGGTKAEKVTKKVNKVLRKHAAIYEKDKKKKTEEAERRRKKKKQVEEEKKRKEKEAKEKKKEGKAAKRGTKSADDDGVIKLGDNSGFDASLEHSAKPEPQAPSSSPAKISKGNKIETKGAPKINEPFAAAKDDQEEEGGDKQEEEEEDSSPPPVGNGGTVDGKYIWTQTLSELTVNIPLPEHTRGRDLDVTISKKRLKIGLKIKRPECIINAPLTQSIIVDDSFWTVEDENCLCMNL